MGDGGKDLFMLMSAGSHHAAKEKHLDTNRTKCLVTAAGVQHLPGKSNTQGADVPATSGVISCTLDCPWLLGHLKISRFICLTLIHTKAGWILDAQTAMYALLFFPLQECFFLDTDVLLERVWSLNQMFSCVLMSSASVSSLTFIFRTNTWLSMKFTTYFFCAIY